MDSSSLSSIGRNLVSLATKVARQYLRDSQRSAGRSRQGDRRSTPANTTPTHTSTHTSTQPQPASRSTGSSSSPAGRATDEHSQVPYPGDWSGDVTTLRPVYAPEADGDPDGGEVVWAWVPFEEDHSRGKDRPVLVLCILQGYVMALPMTSKDHDRDAAQEARAGRHWMDVGSGAWDSRGRPSEVRLDRVLQLDPAAVRREGTALDRAVFERVVGGLATGW